MYFVSHFCSVRKPYNLFFVPRVLKFQWYVLGIQREKKDSYFPGSLGCGDGWRKRARLLHILLCTQTFDIIPTFCMALISDPTFLTLPAFSKFQDPLQTLNLSSIGDERGGTFIWFLEVGKSNCLFKPFLLLPSKRGLLIGALEANTLTPGFWGEKKASYCKLTHEKNIVKLKSMSPYWL